MNKYAVAYNKFDSDEDLQLKIVEANDPVSALVTVLGDKMAPYTAGVYTMEELLYQLYHHQDVEVKVVEIK